MAKAPAKLVTAEEFQRIADPGDGRRFELLEGQVVELSPIFQPHGVVVARLGHKLLCYAEEHDPDAVVTTEVGVVVRRRPDTVRAPDVAYQCGASVEGPIVAWWAETVPDLVVEVASPSDRQRAVRAKARDWLEAGAKVAWIVWPEEKAVEIHAGAGEPATLAGGATLTCPELLPGFALPLRELFRMPGERHG